MRPFFTPRALALLRNMNNTSLDDRATIWHIESGPRGPGGFKQSRRVNDAVDVPCRLAPLNLRLPIDRAIAEQFGASVRWNVLFAADRETLGEGRRMTVTGKTGETSWSVDLEVMGELRSTHDIFHRVACGNLPDAKKVPNVNA